LGFTQSGFPRRLRLRLEIIQPAHLPTFAHEKIDNVRADQTRGASERSGAFHFISIFAIRLLRRGERRYKTISFALRSSREN